MKNVNADIWMEICVGIMHECYCTAKTDIARKL